MHGASLRKEATAHFLGRSWFPGRKLLGSPLRFRMEFSRWQSDFTWSLFYEARSLDDRGPDLGIPPLYAFLLFLGVSAQVRQKVRQLSKH